MAYTTTRYVVRKGDAFLMWDLAEVSNLLDATLYQLRSDAEDTLERAREGFDPDADLELIEVELKAKITSRSSH